MQKISFLGLGVMGYPMAGHLAKKSGADVTVYNRSVAKADQWLGEYQGRKALTPADAARDADLICLCVGNDDDLRQVLTGENGVADTVKAGAIIVDHTTVSADVSREMVAFFADKGVTFLDCPVSGGQAGAVNGVLTIMCGGDRAAYDKVAPIFKTVYAREMRHMGNSGAGQLTKMVNQMCIAGVLQGLAEGLSFGMKSGLDMDEVLAVISAGSAQSWQMENRGKTMVRDQFDFGFAVDWIYKDLGIALDEAKNNGANLPITAQLREFYKELSDQGFGRCDASALIKRLIS
ncbi:NAD(P)-dependent oxidoreductase [Micavibrio aeruginosavorus]|uniref:NAD binding domain of 6-phosphogluconate dehydrogenase family protein n=1 Tax=Micavibrio aeruginosavorus (strain ARL-13) TaxID=856793 RepID=G2KQL7_MICAA|nr:NAD(P)-dependent oxidoreductase [Micavibrio aeruginosavorus]AEP09945.1 NAD binding domain of 6-phosphogluconate dehydrogenase family protein [Micavibrio aeruginosavorus ARL-13]